MRAVRLTTRVDIFDQSYKELRVKSGIRAAAEEALRDAIGPTTVTPVLGGYEIVCRGILEMSDDNENSFLETARRVASKFSR
jgi:hypothetical protein